MAEKKYSRSTEKEKGSRLPLFVLGFFVLGFCFLLFALVISVVLEGPLAGDCVGVVELNGEISADSYETTMFTEGTYGSYDISQKIMELNENENVAAVLLVINSPGGSVVASDEIFRAVDSLDKPTVSYFREVAASGGYYVATPSDYIISEPNALTGSIGTAMYLTDFSELAKMVGVRDVVVKSGEMKDMGNPMRNMTEDEEALLQELVDEAFAQFKSIVMEKREGKLKQPYFNEVLDGRVLSAKMALRAGLVDELGSRETALMKAADLGGIEYEKASDIPVCVVRTKPEAAGLFDMKSFIGGIFASETSPSLQYR